MFFYFILLMEGHQLEGKKWNATGPVAEEDGRRHEPADEVL